MKADKKVRLAADIGGTFTDVVLDVHDLRYSRKVLTTPDAPEIGLLHGIELVLGDAGIAFSDIDVFVHGTTLATNAILERRGAKTALILTEGFRDILTIATEGRYDQYNLLIEKPVPLVARENCYTLPERTDAGGRIQLPLDETRIQGVVQQLCDDGIESVAICFLQSYVNPENEKRARDLLVKALPEMSITVSHEVCPEIREYERASTATANAYVRPLMDGYLARTQQGLAERNFRGAMLMMTSGGGLTSVESARQYPVRLVESGPAGGAIFAAQVAQKAGLENVLSFDMGGTTAKVCLIENGTPATARTFEVDRTARFMRGSGLPLRIPVIEMVEIGAGGGSIAHVDELKRVVIGPESASSTPGPASYGRGGVRPTVTDADVVLGLIEPNGFANGTMTLDIDGARRAVEKDVSVPLSINVDTGAYAIHEMVCENMASAARVHSVETGFPVDRSTMIAFGGAAPLHAARVAEKLGITRLVIPPNAGVGSAVGFLSAPIAFEVVRSKIVRLDTRPDAGKLNTMLAEMLESAREIVLPGALDKAVHVQRVAYVRYFGQGHEIPVDLPAGDVTVDALFALRDNFEREYMRLFGRTNELADIEVVTWSVTVATTVESPVRIPDVSERHATEKMTTRSFFNGQNGMHEVLPVYRREKLSVGSVVVGPAIIDEVETSTFVSASFDAYLDHAGNIVLEKKGALS